MTVVILTVFIKMSKCFHHCSLPELLLDPAPRFFIKLEIKVYYRELTVPVQHMNTNIEENALMVSKPVPTVLYANCLNLLQYVLARAFVMGSGMTALRRIIESQNGPG